MESENNVPPERGALPGEADDHPDSGIPRQLRTYADNERVLSEREAEIAGLTKNAQIVYGDDSTNPNEDDTKDLNNPEADEHF